MKYTLIFKYMCTSANAFIKDRPIEEKKDSLPFVTQNVSFLCG